MPQALCVWRLAICRHLGSLRQTYPASVAAFMPKTNQQPVGGGEEKKEQKREKKKKMKEKRMGAFMHALPHAQLVEQPVLVRRHGSNKASPTSSRSWSSRNAVRAGSFGWSKVMAGG